MRGAEETPAPAAAAPVVQVQGGIGIALAIVALAIVLGAVGDSLATIAAELKGIHHALDAIAAAPTVTAPVGGTIIVPGVDAAGRPLDIGTPTLRWVEP